MTDEQELKARIEELEDGLRDVAALLAIAPDEHKIECAHDEINALLGTDDAWQDWLDYTVRPWSKPLRWNTQQESQGEEDDG